MRDGDGKPGPRVATREAPNSPVAKCRQALGEVTGGRKAGERGGEGSPEDPNSLGNHEPPEASVPTHSFTDAGSSVGRGQSAWLPGADALLCDLGQVTSHL